MAASSCLVCLSSIKRIDAVSHLHSLTPFLPPSLPPLPPSIYSSLLPSPPSLHSSLPSLSPFIPPTLLPQVWSCGQCYRVFHLQCIQKWAVDGVRRQSILSPDLFPEQEQFWSCPNCRHEYTRSQCPTKYQCFCGKLVSLSVCWSVQADR